MKVMSEASRQEKEELLLASVLRETKHSNLIPWMVELL